MPDEPPADPSVKTPVKSEEDVDARAESESESGEEQSSSSSDSESEEEKKLQDLEKQVMLFSFWGSHFVIFGKCHKGSIQLLSTVGPLL